MTDSSPTSPAPWRAYAVPACLAIVWLSPLVSDRALAPFASEYAGFVGVIILAVLAFIRPSRPSVRLLPVIAVAVALLAVLGVSTLRSQSPGISAVGLVGGHAGWALWLLLTCWGLVLVSSRELVDLRWTVNSIAVLGGVASLWAVVDKLGLFNTATRYSIAPSGFFENSLSLGQSLILPAACCVVWWMSARNTAEKAVAGGLLALIGIGFVLAHSSGVLVGLGAAGVTFAVLWAGRTLEGGRSRILTIAWISLLCLAVVAVVGLSVLPVQSGLPGIVQRASHDRATLWRSAWAQFLAHPALGKGPEQFSAWISWSTTPAVLISRNAAYDPHNLLLYWLVAAGAIGFVLFVALVAVLGVRLLDAQSQSRSLAVPVLVAGLVGWMVNLQFAWIAPIAAVTAAALIAEILALAHAPRREPLTSAGAYGMRAGIAAIALVSAAACVLLARPLVVERAWFSSLSTSTPVSSAQTALASWKAWPDPAYASAFLGQATSGTAGSVDEAVIKQTAAESQGAATWHVDLAYLQTQVHQPQSGSDSEWRPFAETIAAAQQADPTSAIWDYLAAIVASSNGRTADAVSFARAGLAKNPPESAVSALKQLAKQR